MPNTIHYETAHGGAVITIDRPSQKNALGPEEWRNLSEAVTRAGEANAVRALVLRGAGGACPAGGDLHTLGERLAQPVVTRRDQLAHDAAIICQLRDLAKPTLAVVDGPALGAGLSLALACDLRIASDRALFGAIFQRVGLASDFGC